MPSPKRRCPVENFRRKLSTLKASHKREPLSAFRWCGAHDRSRVTYRNRSEPRAPLASLLTQEETRAELPFQVSSCASSAFRASSEITSSRKIAVGLLPVFCFSKGRERRECRTKDAQWNGDNVEILLKRIVETLVARRKICRDAWMNRQNGVLVFRVRARSDWREASPP